MTPVLDYHPGYVGVFCRDEAPGAWPNGSRVRKTNSLPGDGHEDGCLGTVLGSIHHEEMGYAYFVEWDDAPGVAVGTAVAGSKGPRLELAETVS